MTDVALERAIVRIAQLEQEISAQKNAINDANSRLSRLEAARAELAAWIEQWHLLAGTQGAPVAAERNEISLPVEKPVKRVRPKNPDREEVVEKALEIIRENERPMSRHDLFKALGARGVVIAGKDPEMVLSTMLWRSKDKIVRLVPFGYWPAGEVYPPHADLVNSVVL